MRDVGLTLTVLGSGSPFPSAHRVSAGYLVQAGRARLLIDAGGGVHHRLGQAGQSAAELSAVLLTHTHIDHSGGLAPVVFAAYMQERTDRLTVLGPAGRDIHPGTRRFTDLLFGAEGAWSYLTTFDGFGIDAVECASDPEGIPSAPWHTDDVTVQSTPVRHGMMPSVAYRVDVGDSSVVVSGDVQEYDEGLRALAAGCDVLVHDFALPERDVAHSQLHAKPSDVGRLAATVGCRLLVLSHFMPEIEDELDAAVEVVRERYDGEIVLARDLLRITLAAGKLDVQTQ